MQHDASPSFPLYVPSDMSASELCDFVFSVTQKNLLTICARGVAMKYGKPTNGHVFKNNNSPSASNYPLSLAPL